MFTGIVEELGEVLALDPTGEGAVLTVRGALVTADSRPGASIAVNGICLTVVEVVGHAFQVDVMRETVQRSTLGGVAPGDPVNLERAASLSSRLGGHLVQGHVDGMGRIQAVRPGHRWTDVAIGLPEGLARYVVEKGSIALDGVALTITEVDRAAFGVSLIPTTLGRTTLGTRRVGDLVNLEVDVIAKYVEKMLEARA